jgi:hypothetical protein
MRGKCSNADRAYMPTCRTVSTYCQVVLIFELNGRGTPRPRFQHLIEGHPSSLDSPGGCVDGVPLVASLTSTDFGPVHSGPHADKQSRFRPDLQDAQSRKSPGNLAHHWTWRNRHGVGGFLLTEQSSQARTGFRIITVFGNYSNLNYRWWKTGRPLLAFKCGKNLENCCTQLPVGGLHVHDDH